MQHVVCNPVRRDSSGKKLYRDEIAFNSALFIGCTIKPMKEGRKPEYPEKTPDEKLQKKPHTKARKFKSPTQTRTRTLALETG